MMTKCTAVIVNYESADVLARCIGSVLCDPAIAGVLVVDNSRTDGAEAVVASFNRACYMAPSRNVGFGPAVNAARKYVRTEFVVIVNPDTRMRGQVVTECISFLSLHPSAALMSPMIVSPAGKVQRVAEHEISIARLVSTALGLFAKWQIAKPLAQHSMAQECAAVNGAFMVARTQALDSVDWFDPRLFLFGEEQDLCRRLRKRGWSVWYAPIESVEHLDGHSMRAIDPAVVRALHVNARATQLRRARGPWSELVYRLVVSVRTLFR